MAGQAELPNFLIQAIESQIVTRDQAERVADLYAARTRVAEPAAPAARFDLVHMLWYLGALIAMGALSLFATEAFAAMGPKALAATGIVYGLVFLFIGETLWRRSLEVPGGLMVAAAVAMVPLAMFGIQSAVGWFGPFGEPGEYHDFYEWIRGGWLMMELSTLVAAAIAVRFYPFGFIAAIAAVALWFLSMDATPWIFHIKDFTWEERADVSIAFGLAFIVFAWAVDIRQRRADFAFWLHLAAVAAFWGGLTSLDSTSELSKFFYLLINFALLALALYLGRRVYALFGALGVAGYLGDLAYGIFSDSLLFPFALSAVGLAIVGLGVVAFKNETRFNAALEDWLPPALKRLRPARG
jgi:hypothetical protein